MSWFLGRPKNALVVMPDTESAQRVSSIDPNGNSAIHQGIAQQVSSLGVNQVFDVEHMATPNGAKVRFARLAYPPMVRPMNDGPTWEDFRELERQVHEMGRRPAHQTKYEREAPQLESIPAVIMRGDRGYELHKVQPDGTLEFVCEVGMRRP